MTKNNNTSIAAKKEPEVVVFNGSSLKKSLNKSGSNITEWKSFMVCHYFYSICFEL
jgi:hypothetical protein